MPRTCTLFEARMAAISLNCNFVVAEIQKSKRRLARVMPLRVKLIVPVLAFDAKIHLRKRRTI